MAKAKAKKTKPKEREPYDWEDDKFPKIADRPVVQALLDAAVLRKMREKAKEKYLATLGPDPAKLARPWKFNFAITGIENVTGGHWETFMAVSETGPMFETHKNRLHGDFQYSKSYKVRSGIRKKFGSMEQVWNKQITMSYAAMQNNSVTVDVWATSKMQFNSLLGAATKTFYDLANDAVYQSMNIKAQQDKGFQIGNVFVLCLCSEVMKADIALNNWQFLPRAELRDTSSRKKLRIAVPRGPKQSDDVFEAKPCSGPTYSWAEGGHFVYKGTKESLANEVLTITVLTEGGGDQWTPQGKALIGMGGTIDYPIAVGVVKTLSTNVNTYVQGRVGGSIAVKIKSLVVKAGEEEQDSSIPKPVQELASLLVYYLEPKYQHLIVTVNSADSLPIADPDYGSSNALCRVKYDGNVQHSPVVMGSLTPCWNHTFHIPVRFIDPKVTSDPQYKKNIFPEEMKSKGPLEIEIWHWDGVPTEYLGGLKLDLYQGRFGHIMPKAMIHGISATSKSTSDGKGKDDGDSDDDDNQAGVGIDPAISRVHQTMVFEGTREKLVGSSLSTLVTSTINFESYFLPDFPPDFKFPEQDPEDIASEQKMASSYARWNRVFEAHDEAYMTWYPDSPPKRRFPCNFTDTSGKLVPLPRLVTPLALPIDLAQPLQIMHWIKCIEFNAPARQRAAGQINLWQSPYDVLALRRGSVQDHAVLLCCALLGLKKDAWVCVGSVMGGVEHTWVMTRENYGTITFWETTTGAKFHLARRWLGQVGDKQIEEADNRFKDRKVVKDWNSKAKLEQRAEFSRQQHLVAMDDLVRLPIAPWRELYAADAITALPYMSVEVVFNGFGVYGNLLNHNPGSIYYDMEADKNSWHSLVAPDLREEMYAGKDVAIPVGPKISPYTAEMLEKNIEQELKESIRMIRMRLGFESAYEDSEVRDAALKAYLVHLEAECKLDSDWAYNQQDQQVKPWGSPAPFNSSEYRTKSREAWSNHWKQKQNLKDGRAYLPVKENHVLSGIPLHFSSSDLKEIRKCIMLCKPIQEYFRYPADETFFFVAAKVFPLPSSVSSVWVFLGAEVMMSKERIMEVSKKSFEATYGAGEDEDAAA